MECRGPARDDGGAFRVRDGQAGDEPVPEPHADRPCYTREGHGGAFCDVCVRVLQAEAGVTRVILTSKTPTALVTDEIDKESDGEAAARKARQLDQDLKTLLKEANEVSVQKLNECRAV